VVKRGEYPVPYDQNGSLLHYARNYGSRDGAARYLTEYGATTIDWRENEVFSATLRIDNVESGRSAKFVWWKSAGGVDTRRYPMFVVDLVHLVDHSEIWHGIVSARWRVQKRGENYGIRLALEDE
jgi:hypothetical protein